MMLHLWYNGTIYAGNGQFIEAFATKGSYIAAAGSLTDVTDFCRSQADSALQRHNLSGRFVCAGFNDSHMHLLSLGKSLTAVNLAEHTRSIEEIIAYLKESLDALLKQKRSSSEETSQIWLTGRGWNQEFFHESNALPSRYDLDQVSTEIPIYLARACGHIAVVNSKALALMGLTSATPQTPDASFDLDEQGEPTGILRENAIAWATRLIPSPSREQIKSMLEAAGRLANSYGITSVQSDDLDIWDDVPFEEILDCCHELQEEGRLHLRINEQCLLSDRKKLDHFLSTGLRTGSGYPPRSGQMADPASDGFQQSKGAELLRIGPLKLILDGSLGANTAWLQEDYADAPGQRGMPLYSPEELDDIVLNAHKNGMQIAMHAIGDGAVQMAIHALRRAQKQYPREDARHGIVHCQLTTASQLQAFRELGLHAYIQSIFLDADAPIVEKRVGHELAATSYQAAGYLQNGVTLSNGSDAPVELPRVMAGIQCAVTRQSLPREGMPACSPYLPDQALTVAQAIDSFTCMGAYASFEETRKGQIMPGMLADFVILAQNPFETEPDKLADIPIEGLVFDGVSCSI